MNPAEYLSPDERTSGLMYLLFPLGPIWGGENKLFLRFSENFFFGNIPENP